MDFRTELAKFGYNKGNSIDVEMLIDEILPSLFSQKKNSYSENNMREMYNKSCGLIGLGGLNDQTENNNRFRELIEKIKKK